ncbi:DUF499 domain-containing protein [Pleurocapsa sp. FMAR1]|uniref:DUF499 domain-containing protein n=1 Tax=Pleurocapsa sp. FMAR1 TaxID=3040204 RepID=UPI0029C8F602|nr:DUF499 domain-containing protein [Pleurocapsa sp. FMAR1]
MVLNISDLTASWEGESGQLNTAITNLQNETGRSALRLEPVSSQGSELYYILRTRLFKELLEESVINDVAQVYAKSVKDAKEMDVTNANPDSYAAQLIESYSFHFSIRDLYARFKENPGFQQTRGLIRLLRAVVANIYDTNQAERLMLIHLYDLDLNNDEILFEVKAINSSLGEAIAHDIAKEGFSVAEQQDKKLNTTDFQDVAKLILVASLANIPNATHGLREAEDQEYKNRILFLTGSHETMERIIEQARQRRAILTIKAEQERERISPRDPQYIEADKSLDQIQLSLRSALQETFTTLVYPSRNGFRFTDCRIYFQGNLFDGEALIRNTLEKAHKFTKDIASETFRKKCQARLFAGQKTSSWNEVKRCAATQTDWNFDHPKALEELKKQMLEQEVWVDEGGAINT